MPVVNMVDAWVRSVKVEKGRTVFSHHKTKGFGLRVSHTGRKVWQVVYRVKGNKTLKVKDLGTFPSINLADAHQMAKNFLNEIENGFDPDAEKQAREEAATFQQLADDYLEKHAKKQKRSWEEDERIIKKDLLPAWGKLKAQDIRRRDVKELLEVIASRAPIQANRTLALARKIFNWALEWDIIESSPCAQVKAVSQENQRDRVLTESEIAAVWEAFEKLSPTMGALFKMRLITAQRGGEVCKMRWEDIDGEWWTIPAEFAKNGLSHRVPLSRPAMAILSKLKAEENGSPWVFPSGSNKEGHIAWFSKATEAIKKESGIHLTPHDLRRTAASWMASMGTPRLTISKILNHSEGGVTRIYDRHSYDAEKAQALNAWADKLIDMLV